MQGNPQFAAVVGPIWARMQDWPESDKLSKALLAMAPPQVQAALGEDQSKEDPEALKQQLQQLEQQAQQMHQMLDMAATKIQELQAEDKRMTLEYLAKAAQIENDEYSKITDRIKATQTGMTPEQVQALVIQVLQQSVNVNPEGAEDLEQVIGAGPDVEGIQPEQPEPGEPPEGEETNQGPTEPFWLSGFPCGFLPCHV
jgi:hypothetical protein